MHAPGMFSVPYKKASPNNAMIGLKGREVSPERFTIMILFLKRSSPIINLIAHAHNIRCLRGP